MNKNWSNQKANPALKTKTQISVSVYRTIGPLVFLLDRLSPLDTHMQNVGFLVTRLK